MSVSEVAGFSVGDWVECNPHAGTVSILTKNKKGSLTHWSRMTDARRLKALGTRSQVELLTRIFFAQSEYVEVRTPTLVQSPGMEPHIRPFQLTGGAFIPTSPEFAIKKIMSGGFTRVFEIKNCFRDEPVSPIHSPEFTMLEFYRSFCSLDAFMMDVESWISSVTQEIYQQDSFTYQGKTISASEPWPRLSTRQLFLEHTGIELGHCTDVQAFKEFCRSKELPFSEAASWDDLYFLIWLNEIEPKLPQDRFFFVTEYPPSQAALATISQKSDGTRWADRFEIYCAGIELGNAFRELTDPTEQRARFIQDQKTRRAVYGNTMPESPIDEDFLLALEEGLPPSCGIAVGFDRLVMLLADEPELDRTLWLSSRSGPGA